MKIGRFDIVRELGRGAQNVVYLARDPQLLREVAIKTLHFTRPDPEQNQTLLAEARAISQLRHPNLVPVFEAGEEGGDLYLVFEYVAGKTLEKSIREAGKLTASKAASIVGQVLDAIAEAHRHGIVHRDLKPSNILVDDQGRPRVMDFGIAAEVAAKEDGQAGYTGTPSYMAPEYIMERRIGPQADVFAAGLVLFEMIYGRRAVAGRDVYQVMFRLANEDIEIPRDGDADVDDRIATILHTATARDPDARYPSAEAFRQAIDGFLNPEVQDKDGSTSGTLDFLLRRMRHKSDFPALSESVSAINRIAQSDRDSIQKLSGAILRDFALTNKLLKLVNSAYFRSAGAGNISTVSRAILVLGFDAVRNLAITVLMFEHLQNTSAKQHLMEEFIQSNFAALMARDLGKKLGAHDAEQSFICGLFHSLGRILSQFYFPEESAAVRREMQQKQLTEQQASALVLGISFEELGIGTARTWGFPTLIVRSMHHMESGPISRPHTLEDKMRVIAQAANEICDVIAGKHPGDQKKAMAKLIARFGEHVGINEAEVQKLVGRCHGELNEFARVVRINLGQTAFGRQVKAISGQGMASPEKEGESEASTTTLGATILGAAVVTAAMPQAGGDGAEEVDGQSILAAGIQDISNTLVEDFKLNDILRIILETMYRAMRFQRVLLCVRDAKTNTMAGRFGFGPDANEVLKTFRFPLKGPPDVFLAALGKGVDVLISNVDDDQIKARIPEWHRRTVTAKTFVLLPLTIKNNPVALIYADRENAGDIMIPERELSLLRTLRNQAVLAIKQSA
ncbi:serine/threonine protein kinase [Sulfuritalea sp.]|uniref:serine/threonine protein kinase n=1 Tax=Sulfuritalea sp. TaxID=2480090 RepID=UPI0025E9D034|nr:serine/threonine protein kinase [Sulfuritalea sp.]